MAGPVPVSGLVMSYEDRSPKKGIENEYGHVISILTRELPYSCHTCSFVGNCVVRTLIQHGKDWRKMKLLVKSPTVLSCK